MQLMEDDLNSTLEQQIIKLIKTKEAKNVLLVVASIHRVNPSVPESVIRQAVWRLINRGYILLAQGRTLQKKGAVK
jgi:hypothetical protein